MMADTADGKAPETPIADRVVRGGFQITLTVAGRGIQMSGYINDGESQSDLNKRIDECQAIITRQVMKQELEDKEGHLKLAFDALESHGKRYKYLLERKKKHGKHPSTMELELNNGDSSIEQIKLDIDRTEKSIEAAKKRIAELD